MACREALKILRFAQCCIFNMGREEFEGCGREWELWESIHLRYFLVGGNSVQFSEDTPLDPYMIQVRVTRQTGKVS